jgi:hypothetical protein
MTKALPHGEAFYFSAYFSLVEKFARNFSNPDVLPLFQQESIPVKVNESLGQGDDCLTASA